MQNSLYNFKLITLLLFLSSIFLVNCSDEANRKSASNEADTLTIKKEPVIKYGFVFDDFLVDTGEVYVGESFGTIMPKYGITQAQVFNVTTEMDSIFSVKKVKPGQFYTVLSKMVDTVKVPLYFIYEIDPIDYMVYSFVDSVKSYRIQKDYETHTLEAGGVISSSLWNAFMDNNLPANLVMEMAKLYAWRIDFFDLKKDDFFKLIYTMKWVEGAYVGTPTIEAVIFNNNKKDYYMFKFYTDSVTSSYYTELGESMKRALLSAPLEFTRISSKFSNSRLHPVLKIYRPHHGVDYAAPKGTEVVATGDGEVIFAGSAGQAGNMVKIKHAVGNIETKYLHLSKFGPGIKKGVKVMQGQKIGEVGSTGISTGAHLDYRVFINGKPVDPLSIDLPSGEPLKDSVLVKFNTFIAPLKLKLDSIPAIISTSQIKNDSIK
jgi:murein DD-endopeptidase MepM/ murein hydrolase activator NlpD